MSRISMCELLEWQAAGRTFSLLDVRRTSVRLADATEIDGAHWRGPEDIFTWKHQVALDRPVIVYCAKGALNQPGHLRHNGGHGPGCKILNRWLFWLVRRWSTHPELIQVAGRHKCEVASRYWECLVAVVIARFVVTVTAFGIRTPAVGMGCHGG